MGSREITFSLKYAIERMEFSTGSDIIAKKLCTKQFSLRPVRLTVQLLFERTALDKGDYSCWFARLLIDLDQVRLVSSTH